MQLISKPFVFARHAQSNFNAAKRIGGSTDSHLSALGEQQAKNAAKLLNKSWSVVCTSDLTRTIQTAKLAVPGHELQHFKGIRERDWGSLEGQPIPNATDYFATPENGEPWGDFYKRSIDTINLILEKYDQPLIIAHSGIYRAIHHSLFGTPEGPRIGNIEPIIVKPKHGRNNRWELIPYRGHSL
ncbi:histidine phosphatase family protein [Marinomonas ostreistagni]|uniref:Histidine phosphatase family protein n=1 Tax=Marinomonas ostreistagni TaxID=359209 RepID=A0ABS0ZBK6_9GAMM|nr:histidine phosphatase family protein [Marinomonas ostreistagni]MBJ7550598.1 histidine phosphatase family protein [Marinomonas ostreistagni]